MSETENSKYMFCNLFIYTENDTEPHRNIQIINIQPNAHKKHENAFHFVFITVFQKSILSTLLSSKFQLIILFLSNYFILGWGPHNLTNITYSEHEFGILGPGFRNPISVFRTQTPGFRFWILGWGLYHIVMAAALCCRVTMAALCRHDHRNAAVSACVNIQLNI